MRPGILSRPPTWAPTVHQIVADAEFLRRPRAAVHDTRTLRSHVGDPPSSAVKPDIVVGDFRISLAASAKVAKVRGHRDAYWSPFAGSRSNFRRLPAAASDRQESALALFNLLRPQVRHPPAVEHRPQGTRLAGGTSARCTSAAHGTPTFRSSCPFDHQTHRYIGAVLWSPSVDLRPGGTTCLLIDRCLRHAGKLEKPISCPWCSRAFEFPSARAGWRQPDVLRSQRPRAYVAEFPGSGRVERWSSATAAPTYQALPAGVPVLALATPTWTSTSIWRLCRARELAGLRARSAAKYFRMAAAAILEDQRYRTAASTIARALVTGRQDAPAVAARRNRELNRRI